MLEWLIGGLRFFIRQYLEKFSKNYQKYQLPILVISYDFAREQGAKSFNLIALAKLLKGHLDILASVSRHQHRHWHRHCENVIFASLNVL